jgi:hypothetical protein
MHPKLHILLTPEDWLPDAMASLASHNKQSIQQGSIN